MSLSVYLCGPMSALTPEDAQNWRGKATQSLEAGGIRVTSPMRGKEILVPGKVMGSDYSGYGDVPELRPQSIFARDMFDVSHADVVLANMSEIAWVDYEGPSSFTVAIPSIGSDFEMAWAFLWRKPIVLIAPPGNPYAEHPFLRGASNVIRFDELQQGLDWIFKNLGVYIND